MSKTLVFADDVPRSTISDRVRRGELRQLHRGVYTTDLTTPAERIIRDEWQQIVARLIPNATISDRSAITGGPNNGVLYLVRDGRPQSEIDHVVIQRGSASGTALRHRLVPRDAKGSIRAPSNFAFAKQRSRNCPNPARHTPICWPTG